MKHWPSAHLTLVTGLGLRRGCTRCVIPNGTYCSCTLAYLWDGRRAGWGAAECFPRAESHAAQRSCHEASRIPVGLAACVRGQIHFRDLAKARTDRASSAPLLLWRLRCALHYSGQLKHVEIPPHCHRTSSRRTAPISKHLHPNTSLHPTPTCRRSRKFHRSIIETNIKKHRDRRNALHQR